MEHLSSIHRENVANPPAAWLSSTSCYCMTSDMSVLRMTATRWKHITTSELKKGLSSIL